MARSQRPSRVNNDHSVAEEDVESNAGSNSIKRATTSEEIVNKLPVFNPTIINPGYDDMVDLKNYTNVKFSDRLDTLRFKYLDGETPLFIKQNLLNIKRKVFVQTPLADDMLTQQGEALVPKQIYPRNKIRTTKYTPINFIPKNLFNQFQNVANGYFLFCIILGAFQIFGVASPGMNAVPLIVIVVLTAARDAFEDSRRGISDNELNNSKIHLVTGLENPNVLLDNVGPWRRFKKANSKFFRNLLFKHIVPIFKKKKNSDPEVGIKGNELSSILSQHESLGTIEDGGELYNNRLSIQTSRFLNARDKISRPIPDTITNPGYQPTGAIKFKNKAWKDIYVGDIVRVRQNEEVPADIVLLSTSLEDQNCYIETKNLDGETNLKSRQSLKAGAGLKYGNDIERIKCWIECDSPNTNLYSFKGVMHYPNYEDPNGEEHLESITIDNVLFRGSTLRNTKWAIGVVIYTGSETKIMLNSGITPTKKSKISRELNLSVYINFSLLFVLCLVSGVINGVFYNKKHISRLYYEFEPYSDKASVSGVVAFFVALILYQSLVPISLYISVEIIKTVQAYFIWSDIKMYYEKLDYPCIPKSWNISDDVGQIEYIFSDKTGTLTQNVMEFKKCSIGLNSYGQCYTEAKMGMQKRLGVDVVKEKIQMDKLIADDKSEMIGLMNNNMDFFSNGNAQTYIANMDENELTFISADYAKDVLKQGSQKALNEWFMTTLALCHTAVTEDNPENDHKKLIKAESPDENALVGVARDVGIEFRGRSRDIMYVTRYGIETPYKVLNVIPFNSTRKRMSVIVEVPKSHLPEYSNVTQEVNNEQEEEKVVVVLTKGADNVIYERLNVASDSAMLQKTALYLEQFSKEGLRTLCVAYRVVDNGYYKDWSERFHRANVSIDDDREEVIESVANMIERDFTLIGTTAIEDRLQDGVPSSIALLGEAGIKLWVLTGDKVETAINIGFSCNLLDSDMKLLVIGNNKDTAAEANVDSSSSTESHTSSNYDNDKDTVFSQIDEKLSKYLSEEFDIHLNTREDINAAVSDAKQNHSTPKGTHAVIVDGAALTAIFDDLHTDLRKKFLLLCKNCKSVLCCRVSPSQKAQVVRATKELFKVMTLAIGDGANDVAMIQAANIGVGIAGEEGRQAVMSSDYGVGQFRFLTRLVLVHGRWSYKRLAEMIPCFFYKNVVFTLTLFWYGIYVNFDGTYLLEFTLIMFYNLAFTSLPIIFLAVLDQDVSDTVSLLTPELYISGILGLEWSQFKFIFYMLDGVYQSVISFYFPYLLYYTGTFVNSQGLILIHRFWMGTMVASISVISCNIYVLLQQKRWDWLSGIIYAFSVLIIFFWIGVWSSSTYSGEFYKAAAQVYGTLTFWCVFFVGVLCNLLPRFSFDTIKRLYRPKDIDIIRERVNMGDYDGYPEGYDPTDAKDVEKYRLMHDRYLSETKPINFDSSSSSNFAATSDEAKIENGANSESTQNKVSSVPNERSAEDGTPQPGVERKPAVAQIVRHQLGSIKRKLTISKSKKNSQAHLSPLEQMRRNMISNGEYVGSRTSLSTSQVPGLTQAESLMSVHSRISNMARE